jgi:hypothetical protein
MRKFFTLVALLACAVIGSQAEVVFSGDAHNVAGWNAKQMPVAEFPVLANASAGDVIVITVTAVEDGARICLQNTAWQGLGYDEYNVETGVYPFVLTEDAATEVKNNGIIVTGQNYSFNRVELLYQKTLWTGDVDATTSWEQSDALDNALFAELQEGDILGVTVTELHEGDWHLYALRANYATNIIEHNMSAAATGVDVLTEDVVTSLKNDPVILVSSYLHATAIHTYTAEKGYVSLWSGTQVVDKDWQGYQSIAAAKLADLEVGNVICVRVQDIDRTQVNTPTVSLFCGWEESDALADGAYEFSVDDEAPMVVEFPVTHRMKHQLGSKDLLVRGANYTMTDIYLLEGTPAANVAAFLNVTSAGMATYVLPFDVPSLPDGVKAYRLTNDGSNEIVATELSELTADQPVLIVAAEGEYEFLSKDGASDDISGKTGTYADGALVGTYQTIAAVPATTATNYNYVLQNGSDGVAFYQVKDATCSIAPYHAYLSCSYNAISGGSPAPMRIRYVENTATGIDETNSQKSKVESRKMIENGQLFIIRDGKTYNALGQVVK